jgi:NCAIR mutase (PurE)-related protein
MRRTPAPWTRAVSAASAATGASEVPAETTATVPTGAGAEPSVVGGLVGVPLVAVPTSVGYGASVGGLSAQLGMLNSCAPGVTVVNIDNGYGAGVFAARVARRTGNPAPGAGSGPA